MAEISSDTKPDSVQSLQSEVETLWKLGEEVASERDAWMQRALNAEEKIKVLQETSNLADQDGDSNFLAIKKAFARLFHPDINKSTGYERAIRTEVFKEFWPEIERIERQNYRNDA